jgi:hypothetical protein
MVPRMCQLLATLCVTSSLALFALGGPDPTSKFHLRTLSYHRPTTIVGPVLHAVVISYNAEGVLYEELGWRINSCLLHHLTVSVGL